MTLGEVKQLKGILAITALYYGHKLEDEVLVAYAEDLRDLPLPAVAHAIHEMKRDPKVRRCPIPADIRSRIQPGNTDEDLAKEAAARIVAAVARFGHPGWDRAREFIGEVGAEVVKLQGGWEETCRVLTYDNQGTLQAQWRDLALSQIRKARAGNLGETPRLPEGPAKDRLEQLTKNLLPSIPR